MTKIYVTLLGTARGIVIRTGDRTVTGDQAIKAEYLKYDKSPLTKDINGFLQTITCVSVFFALLFSGLLLSKNTIFLKVSVIIHNL